MLPGPILLLYSELTPRLPSRTTDPWTWYPLWSSQHSPPAPGPTDLFTWFTYPVQFPPFPAVYTPCSCSPPGSGRLFVFFLFLFSYRAYVIISGFRPCCPGNILTISSFFFRLGQTGGEDHPSFSLRPVEQGFLPLTCLCAPIPFFSHSKVSHGFFFGRFLSRALRDGNTNCSNQPPFPF